MKTGLKTSIILGLQLKSYSGQGLSFYHDSVWLLFLNGRFFFLLMLMVTEWRRRKSLLPYYIKLCSCLILSIKVSEFPSFELERKKSKSILFTYFSLSATILLSR